jgi:hypothetical protein
MPNGGIAAIPRWDVLELSFEGPETGNPFAEVELSARFSKDGRTLDCRGFYDGEGAYKVRFLAESEGEWAYATRSNVPRLDGLSGGVRVLGPRPGRHGPVRLARGFHFAYEDGAAYEPFGTTCYAWTHQGSALEQKTLAALRASPFNKLRMCVFPKDYLYNRDDPALFPFEGSATSGWDFSRPNPEFFRHLESRIAELGEMGVEADLILFHPYDRWGFADMGAGNDDSYLRYLVARLASLPNVWWSMANEHDLMRAKTTADWERLAGIVRDLDPWGHLRSIHNCFAMYDHSRPWITHASVQRVDVYKTSENVSEWRERWRKPVVVDECAYEGDIEWGWGNITGQEMTRRFWEGAVRGGYVGHGETYLNDREELWWSKGGELIGTSPARIAFLRRILEEGPAGGIDPIAMGPGYWDLPCGGVPNEYYLFYFGFNQPRFRTIDLPADSRFRVDVIDTWAMEIRALEGARSGRTRVDLPGRQFMAIRARRI